MAHNQHNNMHTNKSLKNLCCIAPVFVLGALLGGCNNEDHSKPGLNEVTTAVREQYGACPQWTIGKVSRLDGAPATVDQTATYLVKYSFVATLKNTDTAELTSQVIQAQIASNSSGTAVDACAAAMTAILQNARQSNSSLAAQYRITGYGGFTRTESGWHLLDEADAVGVLSVEPSAEGAEAEADDDSTNQRQGIFHRLNLLVLSLFRGSGSHSGEVASVQGLAAGAAPASVASEAATAASPATDTSNAIAASTPSAAAADNTSMMAVAASAVVASVPAVSQSAPPAAASNAPEASVSTALPVRADAGTGQAAKLQLLFQKAQAEYHRAQYGDAVATAEAVLLLDPANAQAQQLRAKALRAEQESTAKASPPSATTAAQTPTLATTTTPASQPVSRALVLADLEGDWQGTYQCGPYSGSGSVPDPDAWSHRVTLTIHNGQAQLVRQSHGEHPYREVLTGTVAADLTLQLSGTGQYADARHAWTAAFAGPFAGTTEQPAFQADGELTNWHGEKTRTCHLALDR